ncbi:NAD-dependent epimerase/dehydratase family protein [Mycobacterium decipiens]|uniref:Diaminohydroxyphosphoribosylaminopyrimidine deaminase n=1 Tax=Mycobacterium decipiens TaxID=1430326 RepID=A0A1X2LXP7_9MYCO|nr:NAD-dependent epimerase/dehydratase family protein [Mycobacterium decipiens]OSC41965.1 diaminohydroxyphosphoribosylaminopyrimidine deaminase [Mycobacterium decipiens]
MTGELDLSGIDVDTSAPVLVTGATGYVAGWIVKGLLDAGVTVHAAVRDPNNKAKIAHLVDMAEKSRGDVRFYRADLLADGSYTEAMTGCRIVFHTASPFVRAVDDPQRDLIDPAVKGTANVLSSANLVTSVSRVVLTSSCAAIYTDALDCENAPGGMITEEIWNTTASLTHEPYSYSKLLAEREAWRIAESQNRWRLVVINPSLVIGPAKGPDPTSESFTIVKRIADGSMKMGAPRLGMGVVDVREVARAHIAAAYLPEALGRHIVSGHNTDMLELAQSLQPRFGRDFPLPQRALPKILVWLVAPFVGLSREFVAKNVGHAWRADNAKSQRELGVAYRPLRESMEDMFAQMIEQKLVTSSAN